MKLIVIDSNIIFKALRSPNAQVRVLLLKEDYKFLAPNFLFLEIFRHKEKLLLRSKSAEDMVYAYLNEILQRIQFVPEEWVSLASKIEAYRLCHDIDEKDTPFVALALDMEADLWTHDEQLRVGLMKKGFRNFFDDVSA
jgi:predicted nucleic acid-binding protein